MWVLPGAGKTPKQAPNPPKGAKSPQRKSLDKTWGCPPQNGLSFWKGTPDGQNP